MSQERSFASGPRGSFEPSGSTINRNKARITGKLKGAENDESGLSMKADHIPISPDSSVNDRFNNFHHFRRTNNSSKLNKDFEI